MKNIDKLAVLRAIDKLDRVGPSGVKQLLTTGRRDESGAWTSGCGLSDNQADLLLYAIECAKNSLSNERALERLERLFWVISTPTDELIRICGALDSINAIFESAAAIGARVPKEIS